MIPLIVLLVAVIIAAAMAVPVGESQGVDLSHLFPSVTPRGVKIEDPNTRAFTGNGGNVLMCPGLSKVNSVRVGDIELPAFIEEQYPVDGSEQPKMSTVQVPLYQLVDTADGPALQRSVKSNDGVWQSGVPIYVSGVWGDAPVASAPTKQPPVDETEEGGKTTEASKVTFPEAATKEELAKALDRLNVGPLTELAESIELSIAGGTTKKDIIAAIIAAKFPA